MDMVLYAFLEVKGSPSVRKRLSHESLVGESCSKDKT